MKRFLFCFSITNLEIGILVRIVFAPYTVTKRSSLLSNNNWIELDNLIQGWDLARIS